MHCSSSLAPRNSDTSYLHNYLKWRAQLNTRVAIASTRAPQPSCTSPLLCNGFVNCLCPLIIHGIYSVQQSFQAAHPQLAAPGLPEEIFIFYPRDRHGSVWAPSSMGASGSRHRQDRFSFWSLPEWRVDPCTKCIKYLIYGRFGVNKDTPRNPTKFLVIYFSFINIYEHLDSNFVDHSLKFSNSHCSVGLAFTN